MTVSENEIDMTSYADIKSGLSEIYKEIEAVLFSSTYGQSIFSGFRIALFGKPNSGKSSLFNAILGFDRAIVSNSPGTTRDTVEAWIDIKGVPVCLIDTAGMWESDEYLDQLGVEKTMAELGRSDLCLLIDENDPTTLLIVVAGTIVPLRLTNLSFSI